MHLETVNALNGSTAFGISPEGEGSETELELRNTNSRADENRMILLQQANTLDH